MGIENIDNNLKALYEKMAFYTNQKIQQEQGISWLNCQPQKWPRTMFGLPKNEIEFPALVNKIRLGNIPPQWIFVQNDNESFLQDLKHNNFRLMMQWPGMQLNLKDQQFENTKAEKITTKEELKQWIEVVNQTLFKSEALDANIITTIFENDESIHFYGFKENDEVVSTGLAFDSKENCGFYMIATSKDRQGKGYSTAVTKQMLFDAKQRNLETAVLQSSLMAKSMYDKLGFKQFCVFNVYWLLGVR